MSSRFKFSTTNNPSKKIPENILEGFALALKSGDLNTIRSFIMENKVKYNISDLTKASENPIHIVLRLSDNVASDQTKLDIIKYLVSNGAPIETPDNQNIWPIHLAAQSQSQDIVEYLISEKILLNRKDSSNNTPLHYAVMGRDIECPKKEKIGKLGSTGKLDNRELIKSFEEANGFIIKLFKDIDTVKLSLINVINTLMKIGEMNRDQEIWKTLEKNVVNIFIEATSDPEGRFLGIQQTALSELINSTYSNVTDNMLRKAIKPISVEPGNGGWGPRIARDPEDIEKILIDYDILKTSESEVKFFYDKIQSTRSEIDPLDDTIKKSIDSLDQNIFKIITCHKCPPNQEYRYGEYITFIKIFILLVINKHMYPNIDPALDSQNVVIGDFVNYITVYYSIMGTANMKKIKGAINSGNLNLVNLNFDCTLTSAKPEQFILGCTIDEIAKNMRPVCSMAELVRKLLSKSQYFIGPDGYRVINDGSKKALILFLLDNNQNDVLGLKDRYNDLDNADAMLSVIHKYNNARGDELRKLYNAQPYFRGRGIALNVSQILDKMVSFLKPTDSDPRGKFNNLLFRNNVVNYNMGSFFETLLIIDFIGQTIQYDGYDSRLDIPIFKIKMHNMIEIVNGYANNAIYPFIAEPYRIISTIMIEYILILFKETMAKLIKEKYIKFFREEKLKDNINNGNIGSLYEIYFDIYKTKLVTGKSLNDSLIYYMLLPGYKPFNEDEFNNPANDVTKDIIKRKWDASNYLFLEFNEIKSLNCENFNDLALLTVFIDDAVRNEIYDNKELSLFKMRIYEAIKDFEIYLYEAIDNPDFQKLVRSYLRLDGKNNPDGIDFLDTFDLITRQAINAMDYNLYFERIRNDEWIYLVGALDTILYTLIQIKLKLYDCYLTSALIKKCVNDTILFINKDFHYYIPQIFLPVCVSHVLYIVQILVGIKRDVDEYIKKISEYREYYLDKNLEQMLSLTENINKDILGLTENIYDFLVYAIQFHNNVISYLNVSDAHKLIKARESNRDNEDIEVSNYFSENLVQVKNLKNEINRQYDDENNFIKNYAIVSETEYYLDEYDLDASMYSVFKIDDGEYNFDIYSELSLERDSVNISNAPIPGENKQINVTIADPADVSTISGAEIPFNETGPFLTINLQKFDRAFISIYSNPYQHDIKVGMPTPIRALLGEYIYNEKREIIKSIVQHFADNYGTNNEVEKIFDDIKNLGNLPDFNTLNDVKVYAIIGQLADSILTEMIGYVTRLAITEWIYSYATDKKPYDEISDAIIKQKISLESSLKDINKKAIENLLGSDNLKYKLSYIEPDPANLSFSTPLPNFIHYLYDIDYHTSGISSEYKKCYQINPNIVGSLVNSDTIYVQNSDGNTALHYAVQSLNSEAIRILLDRGGNALKTFKNNVGQTPFDIIRDKIANHLEYFKGKTVSESLEKFSVPFNDLMAYRLKEDRFNNNIIKNITDGVPIILVIYSHMFYLFIQNYRYNFSYDFKEKFNNLLRKYYGFNPGTYPIDLFEASYTEIEKIMKMEDTNNVAKENLNELNEGKIKDIDIRINEINNQINALSIELNRTNDPTDIAIINNSIVSLQNIRTSYEDKKDKLYFTKPSGITAVDYSIYEHAVNDVIPKINERNLSITEFYDKAFKKIGTSRGLFLAVWKNYLDKNIDRAPTTIFLSINKIMDESSDLASEFYNVVAQYIENREYFPECLEENPVLENEMNIITYMINLILTPAVENIIVNHLINSFKKMDLSKNLDDDEDLIDRIMAATFNGYTINSMLTEKIPELAYKYYSSIYSSSTDPAINIVSDEDLFQYIINIIKANTIIQLTDDSVAIRSFKDNIIPFLGNVYRNFIHTMRLTIYGFEKYLLHTSQLMKIYRSLIN